MSLRRKNYGWLRFETRTEKRLLRSAGAFVTTIQVPVINDDDSKTASENSPVNRHAGTLPPFQATGDSSARRASLCFQLSEPRDGFLHRWSNHRLMAAADDNQRAVLARLPCPGGERSVDLVSIFAGIQS